MRMPEDVHKRGMIQAADDLERMERRCGVASAQAVCFAEDNDRLRAENAAMAAELKKAVGCGACKSGKVNWLEEPCFSCQQDPSYPGWEWKGNEEYTAKCDSPKEDL